MKLRVAVALRPVSFPGSFPLHMEMDMLRLSAVQALVVTAVEMRLLRSP